MKMTQNKLIEYYPCQKKDCIFRTKWVRAWNDFGDCSLLFKKKPHESRQSIGNAEYLKTFVWCATCLAFKPQNNYVKGKIT